MRKKCKRKVYPLNPNIVAAVIESVGFIPNQDFDRLRIMALGSVEALATGAGTVADLRCLSDNLNISETMADSGVGPEALEACAAAQAAVLSIMKRYGKWKKIETTPAELQAFREMLAYLDAQRTSISRGEYEKFIVKTWARIRSNNDKCVIVG